MWLIQQGSEADYIFGFLRDYYKQPKKKKVNEKESCRPLEPAVLFLHIFKALMMHKRCYLML